MFSVLTWPRSNAARLLAVLAIAVLVTACRTALTSADSPEEQRGARVELPQSVGEVRHAGELADHYDHSMTGIEALQHPAQAMADFPRTRLGEVDWVEAIRQGRITPRAGLADDAVMTRLDLDIIMPRTRAMAYVRFSHAVHTEWLGCDSCHDALFEPRQGAHRADMNDILEGRSCGTCHDRVAFSSYACERCHSVPLDDDTVR
ncbi:hypothetical protein DU490_12925 [Halomonas sp. DQ26W]|uniref:c(7)-type cytochrome triheme domain-containing protein n=1 Tax=Halomonas sp. DQ26W TaxID=2282311 RepID=UPI000DF7A67C|nr:c(7)-type cytochrome triheme domain-containing protein [Halomonas sp. DQ26W]RDB42435.1 hypothetical protein DU490_12925 [Halomonas sp. DQ26W]